MVKKVRFLVLLAALILGAAIQAPAKNQDLITVSGTIYNQTGETLLFAKENGTIGTWNETPWNFLTKHASVNFSISGKANVTQTPVDAYISYRDTSGTKCYLNLEVNQYSQLLYSTECDGQNFDAEVGACDPANDSCNFVLFG